MDGSIDRAGSRVERWHEALLLPLACAVACLLAARQAHTAASEACEPKVFFEHRVLADTPARAHEGLDDGRARGGVLVSGGAASSSGLAPREVRRGDSRGVDRQIWRAGLVFSMGAPWTRDFIRLALEGGVLGGRHRGAQPAAIDVRPYGL